ncbi:MAG: ribosomal-processing cysteine protease Prp [Spirochaetaceae bacterium]|jgi:uncharacterized protein YsxB (DUF464 family)|nr:ribosomal-processing cysteine protease Prp [Spirochaetaceae bacterium]
MLRFGAPSIKAAAMIRISAVLDEAGILRACTVTGHAGAGPWGEDVVCAAVSILTRTALRTLLDREGISVRGENTPERGIFQMELDYTGAGREFLAAVGLFLMEGLVSVCEDYPDYCVMTIHTERRN